MIQLGAQLPDRNLAMPEIPQAYPLIAKAVMVQKGLGSFPDQAIPPVPGIEEKHEWPLAGDVAKRPCQAVKGRKHLGPVGRNVHHCWPSQALMVLAALRFVRNRPRCRAIHDRRFRRVFRLGVC